jgi:soluble lytic murein transglycosylase
LLRSSPGTWSTHFPTGAYGLMQLVPPTAKTMARPLSLPSSPTALKQPAVNVALGSRYLGVLLRRFPHDPLLPLVRRRLRSER